MGILLNLIIFMCFNSLYIYLIVFWSVDLYGALCTWVLMSFRVLGKLLVIISWDIISVHSVLPFCGNPFHWAHMFLTFCLNFPSFCFFMLRSLFSDLYSSLIIFSAVTSNLLLHPSIVFLASVILHFSVSKLSEPWQNFLSENSSLKMALIWPLEFFQKELTN